MNTLKFYTALYGSLQNIEGMPVWVLSPARRIIRKLSNHRLPLFLAKPTRKKGQITKGLIVSFTSFPARIKEVWMQVGAL